MIIIPTAPTGPTVTEPRILIIYGAPKVGKTQMLASLPGCLIVDLEDGSDYVTAMKVKARTKADLFEISQALRKAEKKFEFVAIDTVTALEDEAEIVATSKYKASVIGQTFAGDSVLTLPKGAGYLHLRIAFQELISMFSGTTNHVILVAHLKDKSLEKQGTEVGSRDLELTGKVRTITCSKADAIGYVYRKKNPVSGDAELHISFQTLEDIICGARPEHLKGKNMPFSWPAI